jgi:hypothetical protein
MSVLIDGATAILWGIGAVLLAVPVLYVVAWGCDKWEAWRRPKNSPWQEDEHIKEFLPPWERRRK